jgi:hypothetical protein
MFLQQIIILNIRHLGTKFNLETALIHVITLEPTILASFSVHAYWDANRPFSKYKPYKINLKCS